MAPSAFPLRLFWPQTRAHPARSKGAVSVPDPSLTIPGNQRRQPASVAASATVSLRVGQSTEPMAVAPQWPVTDGCLIKRSITAAQPSRHDRCPTPVTHALPIHGNRSGVQHARGTIGQRRPIPGNRSSALHPRGRSRASSSLDRSPASDPHQAAIWQGPVQFRRRAWGGPFTIGQAA